MGCDECRCTDVPPEQQAAFIAAITRSKPPLPDPNPWLACNLRDADDPDDAA